MLKKADFFIKILQLDIVTFFNDFLVPQNIRVHHLGHLLIQLRHLLRVNILGHISTFKEAFDATHLLNNLEKTFNILVKLLFNLN